MGISSRFAPVAFRAEEAQTPQASPDSDFAERQREKKMSKLVRGCTVSNNVFSLGSLASCSQNK